MRTVKITRTRVGKKALAEARRVLLAGEVLVFPTETAYGLAADPRSAHAVREVFSIKGRSRRKPLPFIAAAYADVAKHFLLAGKAAKNARAHWPGPLTVVLPFKKGSVIAKVSGQKFGAVRVPGSAWARAVARAAGGIVTSTSANVSGDSAIYGASKVIAAFRGRRHVPSVVLDAGTLPQRPPSTIVRFEKEKVIVLRQGSVKI